MVGLTPQRPCHRKKNSGAASSQRDEKKKGGKRLSSHKEKSKPGAGPGRLSGSSPWDPPKVAEPVRIASCNVSSLPASWEAIILEAWDILASQYSRLDASPSATAKGIRGISQLTDIQNKVRKKKWSLYRGALAESGKCLVVYIIVRREAFSVHGSLGKGDKARSLIGTWYIGGAAP
eukprot:884341-Heterocapsa_arctica.AAC.1